MAGTGETRQTREVYVVQEVASRGGLSAPVFVATSLSAVTTYLTEQGVPAPALETMKTQDASGARSIIGLKGAGARTFDVFTHVPSWSAEGGRRKRKTLRRRRVA